MQRIVNRREDCCMRQGAGHRAPEKTGGQIDATRSLSFGDFFCF